MASRQTQAERIRFAEPYILKAVRQGLSANATQQILKNQDIGIRREVLLDIYARFKNVPTRVPERVKQNERLLQFDDNVIERSTKRTNRYQYIFTSTILDKKGNIERVTPLSIISNRRLSPATAYNRLIEENLLTTSGQDLQRGQVDYVDQYLYKSEAPF